MDGSAATGVSWGGQRAWAGVAAAGVLGVLGVLALGTLGATEGARPSRVWVFDPASVADYAAVGAVEVVPSRYLALRLRLMAMAGGGRPPTLAEVEVGSVGAGLLEGFEALGLPGAGPVGELRAGNWTWNGAVRAWPRDVHPVALLYREDLFRAAGEDVASWTTWDDLIAACRRYDAAAGAGRRSVEWPRSSASHVVMLMRQTGRLPRRAGEWRDEGLVELVSWYAKVSAEGVGRDAARRVDLLAEELATGRTAAAVVADWRYGQLRRLLAGRPGTYRLRRLPAWRVGEAEQVPTWGGTGVGVPTQRDAAAAAVAKDTLTELYADESAWLARWERDAVVPPVATLWPRAADFADDGVVAGSAEMFAGLAGEVGWAAGVRLSLSEERQLAWVLYRAVGTAKAGGDVEAVVRAGLGAIAGGAR